MDWLRTSRANPRAAALADRHYSRKTVGAAQFAPPGRCIVLLTPDAQALWVSSWQRPAYAPTGLNVWVCTLFRNEPASGYLSSALIMQAVAATRFIWGDPPNRGMITFVDATKIRSPHPGYCFKRAGWLHAGYTRGGLHILHLCPETMPPPCPPRGGVQLPLPLFLNS
ncbi:MAG: hypothetical protein WCD86_03855 [Ktedonobacteraceae bacterium]